MELDKKMLAKNSIPLPIEPNFYSPNTLTRGADKSIK